VIFYPRILPRKITQVVVDEIGYGGWEPRTDRPPRSGFISIAAILLLGKPKTMSIFGMSRNATSARKTVNESGIVEKYDETGLLNCHCDPGVEIEILESLLSIKKGNIAWHG
jgi:hypothetical protein